MIAGTPGAKAAAMELRARFTAWQQAAPELLALAASSPRFNDQSQRAAQLSSLGGAGLEAVAFLEAHAAPSSDWKDARLAAIDEAQKPSGMVKFVFLPSLRQLVEAAAAQH